MTAARGHHFISQCYLKRFTHDGSKESKLWVLSLQDGRSFQSKPEGVGKIRDFNAIEGLPKDALENRLAGFEFTADMAMNRFGEHRDLTDSETWVTISNLMALFAVRNPRMRETFRDFQERVSKGILNLLVDSPQQWEATKARASAAGYLSGSDDVSYERMRDFVQRDKFSVEVANERHIRTEFHVFDSVLKTLLNRQWTLMVAAPDTGGFVTSDHPVCLFRDDGQEPSISVPLGHGLKKTTVLFTLGRDLAAMGSYETGGATGVLQRDQVAVMNSVVLAHAEQQIYAASGKAPVKTLEGVISLEELRGLSVGT